MWEQVRHQLMEERVQTETCGNEAFRFLPSAPLLSIYLA